MNVERNGVGLVLSGGGAKGAYQAGVARALAELKTPVGAVAGASIGALNGAILAAAPSLSEGAERLRELWSGLRDEKLLQAQSNLRLPTYVILLTAAGMSLRGARAIAWLSVAASSLLPEDLPPVRWLRSLKEQVTPSDDGMLTNSPVRRLLDRFLDMDALENGLPLYVSVYPSSLFGATEDIFDWLLAELGVRESRDSCFFHLQSRPREERVKLLLASAALPLLYSAQTVGGKEYADGGLGGTRRVQGNTPITPLVEAGYRTVVVNHLSDGSLWDRHDFPETTVLEIRPERPISRSMADMLAFGDTDAVSSWMEQGYKDTNRCMLRVIRPLGVVAKLEESEQALRSSLGGMEESEAEMREAMRRLEE